MTDQDPWDQIRKTYPPLLTTDEVADVLGMEGKQSTRRMKVLKLRKHGHLTGYRVRYISQRGYRFLLEEVIQFIQSHEPFSEVTPYGSKETQ